MQNNIPYSGPYASYIITISSLSLQLMISSQFTDNDCFIWENSLRSDLEENNAEIPTNSILDRLREAPLFMLNELWLSSISSAIINFTSTTELYIREMIKLSLQRNPSLRKKAFHNLQIPAIDLENELSLDEIKKKIFASVALEQSKGQLFSEKFKRTSNFLLSTKPSLTDLFKSLDSIWELRNDIAHLNQGSIRVFRFQSQNKIIELRNEFEKAEYLFFCISLLNIINEFSIFLKKWDREVLEKWPATSFIQ